MGVSKSPTFHGIASAIRPSKGGHILQMTAVSGQQKHQITINKTADVQMDIRDIASVRGTFNQLFRWILEAVEGQKSQGLNVRIPVIYGWPRGFEKSDLAIFADSLRRAYSGILSERQEQSVGRELAYYRGDPGTLIYGDTRFRSGSEVEMRLFLDPDQVPGPTIIPSQLQLQVEGLMKLEKDEKEPEGLKFIVQLMADLQAKSHLESDREAGASTFFLLAAPKEPFLSIDYINLPGHSDFLRRAYATRFIETTGIRRNICIKVPRDPMMPAFADPVAAKVADCIDMYHLGRINPESVLVKPGK